MSNKISIIIKEYFEMIKKLNEHNIINLFPDFNNVIDIMFLIKPQRLISVGE